MVYKIICVQKQSFRGVVQEKCSGNMKQTHRRTIMPKNGLNKVVLQLYSNHTHVPMHPQNLQHTLRTPSSTRIPLGYCFCISKKF